MLISILSQMIVINGKKMLIATLQQGMSTKTRGRNCIILNFEISGKLLKKKISMMLFMHALEESMIRMLLQEVSFQSENCDACETNLDTTLQLIDRLMITFAIDIIVSME